MSQLGASDHEAVRTTGSAAGWIPSESGSASNCSISAKGSRRPHGQRGADRGTRRPDVITASIPHAQRQTFGE